MHFASVKPSAERLYTFLNMEEERSGSKRVEKEISPILEFKNVRFQYTKDREVLKKVSFKLEPGEKVAIIGKKWKWKINNFNKLSGGEQQRVAIARAISTNAEVILADEPTGNLDVDTAAGIVKIFKELAHEDKKCVIAVTHSEAFAAEADVVVRLEKKKLQD